MPLASGTSLGPYQIDALIGEGGMGDARMAVAVGFIIGLWCLGTAFGGQPKETTTVKPFVPASFVVPDELETDQFRLRPLTVADVEKDYEAVVESRELLQALFRGSWPREGFTLEENLRDLEGHERDFALRQGFTYTMVSLDEERVLGCVYIYPVESEDVDAQVTLWVRQSERANGLDGVLLQTVRHWVSDEWPFERVTYPNREP